MAGRILYNCDYLNWYPYPAEDVQGFQIEVPFKKLVITPPNPVSPNVHHENIAYQFTINYYTKKDSVPDGTSNAAPTALGGFPMYTGDSVTIRLVSAECSGQNSTIDASGLYNQRLFTGICGSSSAEVTLGPVENDGLVSISNSHPVYGAGLSGYSGVYPLYTVFAEDGYAKNRDWDDAVLQCFVIECPFFLGPTGDSLLDDIRVQRRLKELWRKTQYWNSDYHTRLETGGYLFRPAGGQDVQVIEWRYSVQETCQAAGMKAQLDSLLSAGTILGYFHTHPVRSNATYPVTPVNCHHTEPGTENVVFPDGLSDNDRTVAHQLTRMQGSPVDAYAIDPEHVHTYALRAGYWEEDEFGINGIYRNPRCVKAGGFAL
jgi:hypothetical protein